MLDVRTRIEDVSRGGVAVFDGERVTTFERRQVQREILRHPAAVDEQFRARAHGRGDGLDAYLAGSGGRYGFLPQRSGSRGGKPEGPGLQLIPDPGRHPGTRRVR